MIIKDDYRAECFKPFTVKNYERLINTDKWQYEVRTEYPVIQEEIDCNTATYTTLKNSDYLDSTKTIPVWNSDSVVTTHFNR